eukprot:TRINITY_DN51226_c0_g1_i1.p1 TRINITY_DN51226_c0_g1~~TRINITY_DN51226_c0_g1_i1.p1  ORF type:complete len:696 (-),score=382.26 TRINITY_DN51226_c0_g1_i1:141-2228(-)
MKRSVSLLLLLLSLSAAAVTLAAAGQCARLQLDRTASFCGAVVLRNDDERIGSVYVSPAVSADKAKELQDGLRKVHAGFVSSVERECEMELRALTCYSVFPRCARDDETPLPPCSSLVHRVHKACGGKVDVAAYVAQITKHMKEVQGDERFGKLFDTGNEKTLGLASAACTGGTKYAVIVAGGTTVPGGKLPTKTEHGDVFIQADALATYDLVTKKLAAPFPKENVLLMSPMDMPDDMKLAYKTKDTTHDYVPKRDMEADYSGSFVEPRWFGRMLTGGTYPRKSIGEKAWSKVKRTGRAIGSFIAGLVGADDGAKRHRRKHRARVLESTWDDTLLLYISSHGSPGHSGLVRTATQFTLDGVRRDPATRFVLEKHVNQRAFTRVIKRTRFKDAAVYLNFCFSRNFVESMDTRKNSAHARAIEQHDGDGNGEASDAQVRKMRKQMQQKGQLSKMNRVLRDRKAITFTAAWNTEVVDVTTSGSKNGATVIMDHFGDAVRSDLMHSDLHTASVWSHRTDVMISQRQADQRVQRELQADLETFKLAEKSYHEQVALVNSQDDATWNNRSSLIIITFLARSAVHSRMVEAKEAGDTAKQAEMQKLLMSLRELEHATSVTDPAVRAKLRKWALVHLEETMKPTNPIDKLTEQDKKDMMKEARRIGLDVLGDVESVRRKSLAHFWLFDFEPLSAKPKQLVQED